MKRPGAEIYAIQEGRPSSSSSNLLIVSWRERQKAVRIGTSILFPFLEVILLGSTRHRLGDPSNQIVQKLSACNTLLITTFPSKGLSVSDVSLPRQVFLHSWCVRLMDQLSHYCKDLCKWEGWYFRGVFLFIDTVLSKSWRRKQSWRSLYEFRLHCDCTSPPYIPSQVTSLGLTSAVIVNFLDNYI